MSWGAQNRSEDAKTPSGSRGRSDKPELGLWPVQPYEFRTSAGPPGLHSFPFEHTAYGLVLLSLLPSGSLVLSTEAVSGNNSCS
jgi:hypothetical protein